MTEPTVDQLRKSYFEMPDGELLSVAADPDSLTEVARSLLNDELRRRGLDSAQIDEDRHANQDLETIERPTKRAHYRGFIDFVGDFAVRLSIPLTLALTYYALKWFFRLFPGITKSRGEGLAFWGVVLITGILLGVMYWNDRKRN